jgi:hypothetical protein
MASTGPTDEREPICPPKVYAFGAPVLDSSVALAVRLQVVDAARFVAGLRTDLQDPYGSFDGWTVHEGRGSVFLAAGC